MAMLVASGLAVVWSGICGVAFVAVVHHALPAAHRPPCSYVHKLAPRGIYTSGKGSSAVGLTAYVTKVGWLALAGRAGTAAAGTAPRRYQSIAPGPASHVGTGAAQRSAPGLC